MSFDGARGCRPRFEAARLVADCAGALQVFRTASTIHSGRTDRLDARTAAANPFRYGSSSPAELAASKSSTRVRRTDVFGSAEWLTPADDLALRERVRHHRRGARGELHPYPPACIAFHPRASHTLRRDVDRRGEAPRRRAQSAAATAHRAPPSRSS